MIVASRIAPIAFRSLPIGLGEVKSIGVPDTEAISPVGISVASTGVK